MLYGKYGDTARMTAILEKMRSELRVEADKKVWNRGHYKIENIKENQLKLRKLEFWGGGSCKS